MIISGSGYRPLTLAEGERVSAGTLVKSDAQTIVALKKSWSITTSDGNDFFCYDWVVIRDEQYQVDDFTPNQCNPNGDDDVLQRAMGGQSGVEHYVVFYDPALKAENPPEGFQFHDELARLQSGDWRKPSETKAAKSSNDAERACYDLVQGRITWNYQGSKHWKPSNVQRLCRGTVRSTEPASCFKRVMHEKINLGKGSDWGWRKAIDLCEGTNNASGTVACFEKSIRVGNTPQKAIRNCETR